MKTNSKYIELESLRGFAALLVVLFHVPNFNEILNLNFFNNLDLMVDLFFVLSGFVIYSAYSNKIQTASELISFQFLRFGRLYPVHIICLVIFLSLDVARYVLHMPVHSFSESGAFAHNNVVAFIEQLLLVQSFHPGNALTFNAVAWSISVEFYTYILFALIVLYFRQYKIKIFFFIAALSVLALFYGVDEDLSRVLRCLSGFFIGCLTADLFSKDSNSSQRYLSITVFISLLVFVFLNTNHALRPFIYFISAVLIFSLVSNQSTQFNRLLKLNFLVYLGTISYSLYMSHFSALFITTFIVKLYKSPTFLGKDGQMIPVLNVPELVIYILFSMALAILIAHLLYQFVEKPLRHHSRNLSQQLFRKS